jgi:hypothetical protein
MPDAPVIKFGQAGRRIPVFTGEDFTSKCFYVKINYTNNILYFYIPSSNGQQKIPVL